MLKCQCRNCGRVSDYNESMKSKVINDFGHFKFISDCEVCRSNTNCF